MNARRIAALLEVLGVYIVGQYVAALLARAFHLPTENPLNHISAQISDVELLFASRDLFFLLLTQYAGWFLLVVPLTWWRRRGGPAAYGLTRAGKSWAVLLAAGLATAALSAWLAMGVQLLDTVYDFGLAAPWSRVLMEISWHRWQFWLFTAVLSWAFVAFMEELFFRGYCQRRLAEDWGDGPAIFGTAFLFLFSHGQYLTANVYHVALLASLLVLAIGIGVVFAWSGSLVPAVVAHSIVNFPLTLRWQLVVLAALMAGAVLVRRRGIGVVKQVFSGASVLWCLVLGAAGAAYAIASQGVAAAVYVASAMLGLAIGLEAMQRGQDSKRRGGGWFETH